MTPSFNTPYPSIYVGKDAYQWNAYQNQEFNYWEVDVRKIGRKSYRVVFDSWEQKKIQPQMVRQWIEMALKKGGFEQKEEMRYEVRATVLYPKNLSYREETTWIQKQADFYGHKQPDVLLRHERRTWVADAEQELGLSFPYLLKLLYIYFGNGNFGPSQGILPLFQEQATRSGQLGLVELHQFFQHRKKKDATWQVPHTYIFFMDWGNDIYSAIDVGQFDTPVYVLDNNLKTLENSWDYCMWKHSDSLYDWVKMWLDNKDESGRVLWMDMYKKRGLIT